MSKETVTIESHISKRSKQAKKDIDKLKDELQRLIEAGQNRHAINTKLPDTSGHSSKEQRNSIKKTDLHPSKISPLKPHTISPSKEKSKPYNVEETRDYMRKQKEKRLNSLKNELKSSEQNIEVRKRKLKDLHTKARQLLSNNVQRPRSRSKSKEKNSNADVSPDKRELQHISRKESNSKAFRINPDVINNLPYTSDNQNTLSSKEALFKNVTIRVKSPRSMTSASSIPILVVSEGKDINRAATKIQAAYKGYKQRICFKRLLLEIKLNSRINPPLQIPAFDLVEEKRQIPKWLETKLRPAPYNLARTYKRKLSVAANKHALGHKTKVDMATQSSENLLENGNRSREEIKKILKDNVKNNKHKDLKSFLSHKCLDLDLKKVEELNLVSKEKLKSQKGKLLSSDSDTSKNIPDLSTENTSSVSDVNIEGSNQYSLDINSKRLQELRLHSNNTSVQSNQQLNNIFFNETTNKSKRRLVNTSAKENANNAGKSNYKYPSDISRKGSNYIATTSVNRSIEMDSSREITPNSSRNLFNPRRINKMLLLTALDNDLDESKKQTNETNQKRQRIEAEPEFENDLSVFKNNSFSSTQMQSYFTEKKISEDNGSNKTLSNSEVELEICSNVSMKQLSNNICLSTDETDLQELKRHVPKVIAVSEKTIKSPSESIVSHSEFPTQSTSTDLILNTTFESEIPTEGSHLLSSTTKNAEVFRAGKLQEVKLDKVIPVKSGEVVTATTNSNQINIRFQAEIHLLNDFNQSLCSLRGIETCLNNLQTHSQNPKTICQNQNTQTSFIASNKSIDNSDSPNKNSIDTQIGRSANIFNSSAISSHESSFLNGSVFEKFNKISKSMKDESILNDTQVSKMDDVSIADGENNTSFTEVPRPMVVSKETLSLQHFEQLIKDEDARRDYLKTIFEIHKDGLLDRAKIELSTLEIQKKHFVETGQLSEASTIRKKQRGILIKLQHEKYEMQRLMQMQKAASKERKKFLKEQQNVVKAQLTLNDTTTVSNIKKNHHTDRRSSGPLKVFAPAVTQQHRLTSLCQSDISVSSRRSSSIAEELIVTSSYRSDGGTSVTSVTQETTRQTTSVTTEQRDKKDGNRDEDVSIIITEINNGNKALSAAADLSDKCSVKSGSRRSKSLEGVNRISDEIPGRSHGRKSVSEVDLYRKNVLVSTGQMDYFSVERLDGMLIVESQLEHEKHLLLMRENALQKRREAAEELLEWHQRLLEEEKKVAELEMAVITHIPIENKQVFISARNLPATITSQQPQMNIIWSARMTGKGSSETVPESDTLATRSDVNNIKSLQEQVINTKSDSANSDVQSDYLDNDKSSSNQSEAEKACSKHSSESYSCEFDHGETTDNIDEDEVSLRTVKSSEHEDVNILKSQSTLNDIMYNISIISEELSEIYRLSSGNKNLDISENVHLQESKQDRKFVDLDSVLENGVNNNKEVFSTKNDIKQSSAESNKDVDKSEVFLPHSEINSVSESIIIPGSFSSEEVDILEQNIKLIEKEIEELQSNTINNTPDISEINTSQNNFIELDDQIVIESDDTITENNSLPNLELEKPESIDLYEIFADETSEISKTINSKVINQSKEKKLVNKCDVFDEKDALIPTEIISEELNNSKHPISQPSALNESNSDKSEVLTSKAPDIIESLSRNTEENVDSHSSSKMPEILENLNEEHEGFAEDFDTIAIVNEDIVNTVRMCTQDLTKKAQSSDFKETVHEESNESTFDVLDDFSITNDTCSIENRLDATFVVQTNVTEDDTILEAIPQLFDLKLINNSHKYIESLHHNEGERMPLIYGGNEARISRKNVEESTSSNSSNSSNEISLVDQSISKDLSSKTDGVLNVKKRVSEILADVKHKTDKSTRIQDLYTTTYDVSFTEKASEIVSELDQLDPDHISPKLVEVKAEELELLKKQLAIEQEIKQLEEQQLTEKREQLPYQFLREIPNKPPPPYTPPVTQAPAVATPSVIPSNITQMSNAIHCIAHYLHTCHSNKTLQAVTVTEVCLSKFNTPEINELLFDVCKELTLKHYEQFEIMEDESVASWMRPEESISSLKRPFDVVGLCKYLEEKCMEMYGFKERANVKESSIMRWSRKKRDHVDEVLVRELQIDESNWINYEQDERIVADKLVTDLTDLMLKEVLIELGDWWSAKKL